MEKNEYPFPYCFLLCILNNDIIPRDPPIIIKIEIINDIDIRFILFIPIICIIVSVQMNSQNPIIEK